MALSGGEDYELLFTAREDTKIRAFCVGEIVTSGMRIIDAGGRMFDAAARGYRHFAV
jgi:thiamine monophosphate kinase